MTASAKTPLACSLLAGAAFLLIPTGPASAQVVISEVLAWTQVNQNPTDEFIELCNTGLTEVDVAGWGVTDGDLLDNLLSWNAHEDALPSPSGSNLVLDSTVLPPGHCGLVLDPNYATGSQPYFIADGTIILTIGTATNQALGNGLDTGDAVTLFGAGGTSASDVVDTYGTPVLGSSWEQFVDDGSDAIPFAESQLGRSSTRLDLAAADGEGNWEITAPTPGYRAVGGVGSVVTVAADGNGDFTTINAAVLAVSAGTEIRILAGNYVEDVALREAVTLIGESGATLEGHLLVVHLNGVTNIADLSINGGIEVEASEAHITGCQLSPALTGILFHNASGSILDNVITGGATGVLARQGASPTIVGNTVTETTERAIACEDGAAPLIDSNILTGSLGIGINCTNDPVIVNNSITGFSIGMALRSGLALATGNTVVGASDIGVHISSTTPGDYPTVRGNTIAQGGGAGVLFEWSGGTLESNVIAGNSGPGVEIEGGFEDFINPVLSDHPVVLGNSIIGNSEQGIYIWGSLIDAPLQVAAPTILGNIISSNSGFGIEQTLSAPSLGYNDVFGNLTGNSDGNLGDTDISEDPLFVNIGSGDFTLSANSPCIDLVGSEVLWSGTEDRAGAERVTDGNGDGVVLADAGAFEFVLTCPDADGDGYQDAECADVGEGDCDDTDATINPGADEVWYDGVDQNCDGIDDDQDGDGFIRDEDCDDTDASIAPGDCDEIRDPGFLDEQGCDCSMGSGRPASSLAWLLVLAAGLVRRRR